MSRALLVAGQIARNSAMRVPVVTRWRVRRGRTALVEGPPQRADLQRYAYDVFDMLARGVEAGRLNGARVVEIGPGDHIPAALLFLAAGAERYLCVDRFAGDVAGPAAKQLYAALGDDLAETRPALADALRQRGISCEDFPEGYPELVEIIPSAVEDVERDAIGDVLLSYNAVEHLTDVAAFARNSFRLLRPGGVAIHRVDFDAHDVWLAREAPHEWLTISDPLWRLMGSHRGAPNRLRFHEVRECLEAAGFHTEADVLDRFDLAGIRAIRPSLAHRFRTMPEDSLTVRTACFRCQVP